MRIASENSSFLKWPCALTSWLTTMSSSTSRFSSSTLPELPDVEDQVPCCLGVGISSFLAQGAAFGQNHSRRRQDLRFSFRCWISEVGLGPNSAVGCVATEAWGTMSSICLGWPSDCDSSIVGIRGRASSVLSGSTIVRLAYWDWINGPDALASPLEVPGDGVTLLAASSARLYTTLFTTWSSNANSVVLSIDWPSPNE